MTHKTIVVIDDEPQIRDIIRLKLAGAGFEVHTAGDGHEGLEIVRKIKPCLVITDLKMPKMNGLEVCAACRECPLTREIPIILVTGSGTTLAEVTKKIEPFGKVECISKPFSLKELLRVAQQAVHACSVRRCDRGELA